MTQKHVRSSRPYMPGYEMMFDKNRRELPWDWASERLASSRTYWFATNKPDGRPHVMPIWGIWLDQVFYFSTGRESRKSRNLKSNPHCAVCPDGAGEAVILEGTVSELKDSRVFRRFAAAYKKKYNSDIEEFDRSENPIYSVRPSKVFGFIETSRKINGNPTRWNFTDASQ